MEDRVGTYKDIMLEAVIVVEYCKPYAYFGDNCLTKTLKINARARKLGMEAKFMFCVAILPHKKGSWIYEVLPHFYSVIDVEEVDVALDPQSEEEICMNSEVKKLFRINISRAERFMGSVARIFCSEQV